MLRKATTLIVLLLFTISVSAQLIVKGHKISPNFQGFSGVLLIQGLNVKGNRGTEKWVQNINEKVQKRFKKFYKGEFEFIEPGDEKSSPYKMIDKYPFIIKVNLHHVSGAFTMKSVPTYYYSFIMVDRKDGKEYESNFGAENTIPTYWIFNNYAEVLSGLIKQN